MRRHLFGANGLCGAHFAVAERHHQHSSVKVICDEVRAAPGDVTIVATGPLTNIAAALQQQPDLASLIGHLIMLGGTLAGPGNVTAAAEFNIYCDAEAARDVFRSPVTKTLIPIDVTSRVVLDFDLLEKIPDGESRTRRAAAADSARRVSRLSAASGRGRNSPARRGGDGRGAAAGAVHDRADVRRRGNRRHAHVRGDGVRSPAACRRAGRIWTWRSTWTPRR